MCEGCDVIIKNIMISFSFLYILASPFYLEVSNNSYTIVRT